MTGSELFTGNCLLLAPAVNRDIKFGGLFKNLSIVYAANLLGSVFIALIVVYSGTMSDAVANAAVSVAAYKCNLNFGEMLAAYFPIFAFVACGFEHCVANMYYLTAGLLSSAKYAITASSLNVGNALLNGLLASTIGNVLGGMLFVAIPLWLLFFRKTPASNTDDGK